MLASYNKACASYPGNGGENVAFVRMSVTRLNNIKNDHINNQTVVATVTEKNALGGTYMSPEMQRIPWENCPLLLSRRKSIPWPPEEAVTGQNDTGFGNETSEDALNRKT